MKKKKEKRKVKKDGNILRYEVTHFDTYHFDSHKVQFAGKEY